jgi:hypothetical protein
VLSQGGSHIRPLRAGAEQRPLRGGLVREDAVDGKSASASDHDRNGQGQREQVIFVGSRLRLSTETAEERRRPS